MDDFKSQDLTQISDFRGHYFSLLNLLEYLLESVDESTFDDQHDLFTELFENPSLSYSDFIKIQREKIGQLTEEEVRDLEAYQRILDKIFMQFAPNGRGWYHIIGFFFGPEGIVMTSMY